MKKGIILIMLVLFVFTMSGYSCGGHCPGGVCEKPDNAEEQK